MASHNECEQERWLRGSYYVRPLHPTLQLIMWDYGYLNNSQEEDYINTKLSGSMPKVKGIILTNLIVKSQRLIRYFAHQQLLVSGFSKANADIASHSCVSQRDIQRVFSLYNWLMMSYQTKPHGESTDYHYRAVLVALGVVYYMRLNAEHRKAYKKIMDKELISENEVKFSNAFSDEIEWYMKYIKLPQGVARTQALKENIFATIICTVTKIPLIIVGPPGASKTLSFHITIANLKGKESKVQLFREVRYPSLYPDYYQCSRRTTSNEIEIVFSRAINRQRSLQNTNCVVFMDEAGLPEESHESLKVLHYYLDNSEVSFVAITNHVLDAAKSNRAISLFRPENPDDDLETLAKGCLCSDQGTPPGPELKKKLDTVTRLTQPYLNLMKNPDIKKFFGLRDFIHFINYLRRRPHDNCIDAQAVIEALERNFNGSPESEKICQEYLKTVSSNISFHINTIHHLFIII